MMNKTNMRRPYAAPSAELVCLTPGVSIASNKSWKWGGSENRDWTQNSWGSLPQNFLPSVTGVAEWLGDELDAD